MADITTSTLKIGSDNLVLRDADAQEQLVTVKDGLTAVESDVTDLKEDLSLIENLGDLTITPRLEDGGINGSGSEFSGSEYMRFSDYYTTASATNMVFNHTNSGNESMYVAYYDENKVFKSRVNASQDIGIDTEYSYFRLSFYRRQGADETTFRSWFTWVSAYPLKTNIDYINDIVELKDQISYTLESGGINSSGEEISGSTYMRFANFIPTSDASGIVFKTITGATGSKLYAVYYTSAYVFVSRVEVYEGYEIDTTKALVRLSYYEPTGANEQLFRSWIYWSNDNKIVKRFEKNEQYIPNNLFTKSGNEITISTNKAKYIFKKVTNQDINVDTWRLYSGYLKTPSGGLFEMWTGSDAEGVVKLVGEDDYICGFHGDEIATNISIIVDGDSLDLANDYAGIAFKIMNIYVESDVYHCNTSADAETKAFKRNKMLTFIGDKVVISNDFIAVDDVLVQQAPLAFFQCYKNDASSQEILHGYSVNSDYKVYSTSDTSSSPTNSEYLTEAIYNTSYGEIQIKDTRIDPRFAEHYFSDVSIATLVQQGRLKIYFNTIKNTPTGVAIQTGDDIFGSFEWEIT